MWQIDGILHIYLHLLIPVNSQYVTLVFTTDLILISTFYCIETGIK